jgi:hypothetical protein
MPDRTQRGEPERKICALPDWWLAAIHATGTLRVLAFRDDFEILVLVVPGRANTLMPRDGHATDLGPFVLADARIDLAGLAHHQAALRLQRVLSRGRPSDRLSCPLIGVSKETVYPLLAPSSPTAMTPPEPHKAGHENRRSEVEPQVELQDISLHEEYEASTE